MNIAVTLIGTPQVIMDGHELIFPYRKAEGLFYYLCVRNSISRDEAIGIFWADCAENAARKNLRDALYHLKKLFNEDIILSEGNNRICLQREKIASIDYEGLMDETLLNEYNGDFLGYFYIKNCMEFEEWVDQIREDLRRRFHKTVQARIAAAAQSGKAQQLTECATMLLCKQISDEALYRQILGGLFRSGEYTEAQNLYEKLEQMLSKEFDAKPEEQTSDLMKEAELFKFDRQVKTGTNGIKHYFFCREHEMALLLNNLRQFKNNNSAVSILLCGEAGVGKSTILHKVREAMGDEHYITFSYQCVQTEAELYLKPWNDLLAQVETANRACNQTEETTPDFYQQQMDAAIFATQYELCIRSALEKLNRCMVQKNIVIMIDDVQWMDNASRRLLSNLIFWSRNEKILFILAGRDSGEQNLMQLKAPLVLKGLLQEIIIPRFTREETRKIITEYTPDLLQKQDVLNDIYVNTAGNALFLLEFLKELKHGGSSSQLSEKTKGMIQSRLLSLVEEDRNLLNIISLNPRFATLEDIQILDTRSKVQIINSLERVLSCQLICLKNTYKINGYGFSHQLIRDYIYHELLEDKRKLYHAMVAEYEEEKFEKTKDESLFPLMIHHFTCSGNLHKTYTYRLEYLRSFYAVQHEIYPTVMNGRQEIDIQMRQLDGEDELVNLAKKIRALDQGDADVETLRMKMEFLLGRYDLFSGAFDKGLSNIKVSIEIARKQKNKQYLMENYLQMVFHAIQIHNLKMFNEYISACEELIEKYEYSEADHCTVLRLRGLYYMKNFRYTEAEKSFHEVILRLEPLCTKDRSFNIGMAACYNYLGEGRQAIGELDEALNYYLQAIALCEGERVFSGLSVFYSNAGYAFYCRGDLDQAEKYIEKANHCTEDHGALWGRAKAKAYAALIAVSRERWDDAQSFYCTAREFAQQGGNPTALSLVHEVEKLLEAHKGL